MFSSELSRGAWGRSVLCGTVLLRPFGAECHEAVAGSRSAEHWVSREDKGRPQQPRAHTRRGLAANGRRTEGSIRVAHPPSHRVACRPNPRRPRSIPEAVGLSKREGLGPQPMTISTPPVLRGSAMAAMRSRGSQGDAVEGAGTRWAAMTNEGVRKGDWSPAVGPMRQTPRGVFHRDSVGIVWARHSTLGLPPTPDASTRGLTRPLPSYHGLFCCGCLTC